MLSFSLSVEFFLGGGRGFFGGVLEISSVGLEKVFLVASGLFLPIADSAAESVSKKCEFYNSLIGPPSDVEYDSYGVSTLK